MRTVTMKRMPAMFRDRPGAGVVVVLDMDLPDDAFGSDGLPRNGYVIGNDVRCWVEVNDMGRVHREQVLFGELQLA